MIVATARTCASRFKIAVAVMAIFTSCRPHAAGARRQGDPAGDPAKTTGQREQGDLTRESTAHGVAANAQSTKPQAPETTIAPNPDRGRLAPSSHKPSRYTLGPEPRWTNLAASRGIDFVYFADFRDDRFLLPENMGGGAAWLDYDGDGQFDLFITNGCSIPPAPDDRRHVQQLYRQDSSGNFVSMAKLAHVDLVAYGQGCTAGDLDNDGFSDLVVSCYGPAIILRNNGDGTFADYTVRAGIKDPGWSTSAALGDPDRDGDLDLYVAHYGVISLETNPVCFYEGRNGKVRGYCGPDNYEAEPDSLFENQGDFQFQRVNSHYLGNVKPSKGLGVVFADFNNDRWPDIYVANDMDANFLFQNRGDAGDAVRFSEVAMSSGAAVSGDGVPEASMGIACADFDGDADLDIFLTHYYQQKNTYYENLGSSLFADHSAVTGLAAPSLPYLGFGTCAIDYNLDGWQDLFVTNGHVLGPYVQPYAMEPQLFANRREARFAEVKVFTSSYFRDKWVGRGAASGDFDNDGDEDLVVVHQADRPIALLRNDIPRLGTTIGFEFVGMHSNRTALGTRIHLQVAAGNRMRELIGGGSYLSAHDPRIVIGVPASDETVQLQVDWPSGRTDHWEGLQTGRYWRLTEGRPPVALPPWRDPPRTQAVAP